MVTVDVVDKAASMGATGGAQLLNFEDSNQKSFSLLVRATDGGGQVTVSTVTISVTDVNEAPVFTESGSTLSRTIDETCGSTCSTTRSASTTVGNPIASSDPDVLASASARTSPTLLCLEVVTLVLITFRLLLLQVS